MNITSHPAVTAASSPGSETDSAAPAPVLLALNHVTPAVKKSSILSIVKEHEITQPKPKSFELLPPIQSTKTLLADMAEGMPPELIQGLLHQGTKCVLSGPSKVGKTWLLLDMAISVTSGTSFLIFPTVATKVLYVNLEIQHPFMKQRLHTILEKKQLSNADLDVWSLRGHTVDPEFITDAIINHAQRNYGLIILDPIYKLLGGRSENTAAGVGTMCNLIERILRETGATVVYAHHYTKGNQSRKKSIDRMSGSGVFARDADTIIMLTEHERNNCYTVEMTLRNLTQQQPFVVQWAFPLMNVRGDLDPGNLRKSGVEEPDDKETAELILSLLSDKPLATKEWEKAANSEGVSRATFYRWLDKLKFLLKVSRDRKTKTWSPVVSDQGDAASETHETAAPNVVCAEQPDDDE